MAPLRATGVLLAALALVQLLVGGCSRATPAPELAPFDWTAMKKVWRQRIERFQQAGVLPLIDIESSYGDSQPSYPEDVGNWEEAVTALDPFIDEGGVAIIAFGAETSPFRGAPNVPGRPRWAVANHLLVDHPLPWFLPVPRAGQLPGRDGSPKIEPVLREAERDGYPMLGEFFFRHYPSNTQLLDEARKAASDYDFALDGPLGDQLLSWAAEHRVPVQLHYEVEDRLLAPLERALERHPDAPVIWCHFGRVRYPDRGPGYTAKQVERLLKRFPNLYFDTSVATLKEYYPPSNAFACVLYDRSDGSLLPEWKAVMEKYPWRFLCGLDMGSDRCNPRQLLDRVATQRYLLGLLSPKAGEIVAWRAAWRLLFHEELP